MKALFLSFVVLLLSGCSVFGESGVEIAPYTVIEKAQDAKIEIRNYESMILVSTPMIGDQRDGAFRKLFRYISGDNVAQADIAMTAPVFMDGEQGSVEGQKIAMTAPVFMDQEGDGTMSFVMPASFTLQNTPKPTDPDVSVTEVKDYRVAAIIFSGRLNEVNIAKHRLILQHWIDAQGYEITGPVKTAGYNAPFTLPALRRNEVLIPVDHKN